MKESEPFLSAAVTKLQTLVGMGLLWALKVQPVQSAKTADGSNEINVSEKNDGK